MQESKKAASILKWMYREVHNNFEQSYAVTFAIGARRLFDYHVIDTSAATSIFFKCELYHCR
jgi:hypothetical protein